MRDIPDTFVIPFGVYKGKTYAEVKTLDPDYAKGLQNILDHPRFDKWFL